MTLDDGTMKIYYNCMYRENDLLDGLSRSKPCLKMEKRDDIIIHCDTGRRVYRSHKGSGYFCGRKYGHSQAFSCVRSCDRTNDRGAWNIGTGACGQHGGGDTGLQ